MPNHFRVRVRNGDFEVEVESSDKSFVEAKLKELLTDEPKGLGSTSPSKKRKPKTKASNSSGGSGNSEESTDVAALVAQIHEDEKFSAVEEHVLDNRGQLPRVLMALYYADQILDSPELTVGEIVSITDQLGKKIKSSNVSTTIGKNRKYIAASAVRKPGASVKYKINRPGKQAFEKMLKGEKV